MGVENTSPLSINLIKIFTDHQPLIYAISEKNPNSKMKRWRVFIEEFSPKFYYKPGSENKVADALSRQFSHNLNETKSAEIVHSEVSSTNVIKTIKNPINQLKNQLLISKSGSCSKSTKILFKKIIRHTITYDSIESLIQCLKCVINYNVTNGIRCDLPKLGEIQSSILLAFPGIKFVHTELLVIDLINKDEQLEAVVTEHNRAHHGLHENSD